MNINNRQELELAIKGLEAQKVLQQQNLTTQYHETLDSVKPGNLIKSAVGSIDAASILKTAAALGAGLVGSRLSVFKGATGAGKKIINGLVKTMATNTVLSNKDKIKAYGKAIIKNFSKKKTSSVEHNGVDHF